MGHFAMRKTIAQFGIKSVYSGGSYIGSIVNDDECHSQVSLCHPGLGSHDIKNVMGKNRYYYWELDAKMPWSASGGLRSARRNCGQMPIDSGCPVPYSVFQYMAPSISRSLRIKVLATIASSTALRISEKKHVYTFEKQRLKPAAGLI